MKPLKHILLFALLVATANINTHGQKITKSQYDALNNYIDYLNFCVDQMTKEMQCLYEYYGTVESYRLNEKKYYGLNPKSTCAGKEDSYEYNKALSTGKSLNNADALSLIELLNSTHTIYLNIINLLRDLEIYNRLKDYETDNFEKHTKLVHDIQKEFSEYRSIHNKLSDAVYNLYRKWQPFNSNNIYHVYEQKLLQYIENENISFFDWGLNFEKQIFTNRFPYEELITNINETDKTYYPFGTDTKLEYPVSHYYSQFWGSVRSIQANKRNAVDDYTFKEKEDDSHSNESYRTYLNYFNHALINEFNNYVWASGQKGIYLLKHEKTAPYFVTDKNPKSAKQDTKKEIPEIGFFFSKMIDQTKPVTKEIASAFNNYIEYINREIRIASDRPKITEGFIGSVERYKTYPKEKLEKYNLSSIYITDDYRLATSYYQKALNDSRFLPEEYANALNGLMNSIKIICDNRKLLTLEINKYIKNRTFLEDNFKAVEEFATEFEALWKEFDKRTNMMYQLVEKMFLSYPKAYPEYSWQLSGDVLKSLLEEDHKLLLDAKNHYLKGEILAADVEPINNLSRQILTDQYKNMSELQKIGRNHGHCPFTPYEDIPQDSRDFVQKYEKQKQIEMDTILHGKYRDFLYTYNEMVEDYNKFVWLAEGDYETARNKNYKTVFLLKAKREFDIFKIPSKKPVEKITTDLNEEDKDIFGSMEGYAENNLILLLDVSQSMNKEEKLPLLKNSFKKLLKILRKEDQVAIVIYSGDAQIAMGSTSCSEKEKISEVIDNLDSGGSTNIEEGMKTAYKLAKNNFISNGNNRIILATDGEFEVSSKLVKLVDKIAEDNICLSVFHYGKNKGKKISLYELSQTGKGNYEIITKENSDKKLVKEAKAIVTSNRQ